MMNKVQPKIIGSRFGRWVAVEERQKQGSFRIFLCVCDCGNHGNIRLYNLLGGRSSSCGCVAIEKAKERRNSGNVNWKGDAVGLSALHGWVKRRLQKPNACQKCDSNKPLDLANISQQYKRDLSDWEWLCRRCHITNDGRIESLSRLTKLRQPRGVSKYKGVRWHKGDKRWRAQVGVNGKSLHLGSFDSEEEAAIYYNVAVQLFFEKPYYLNNI